LNNELERKNHELIELNKAIYNSRSWKFINFFARVNSKVFRKK